MNISNTKTILFFSISTLMMNGCIPKNELVVMSPKRVMVSSNVMQTKKLVQPQNTWKRFKPSVVKKGSTNKQDCVDCYASPIDYSKPPSASNNAFSRTVKEPFKSAYAKNKISNTKYYGSYAYTEKVSNKIAIVDNYEKVNANKYVLPVISTMNNSYGSYNTFSNNSNISIQVGAFRKYSGAKRYMKRYSALSSNYRVIIKTGRKNNQPLYRVQIEGFKNDMIAKRFMDSYGIQGAFLVRR